MRLSARANGSPELQRLLASHPHIDLTSFEPGSGHVHFDRGDWPRDLEQGRSDVNGPYGLCELLDNNPLVCADSASVPGPAATLALIAAGPLAKASLLVEPPALVFSFDEDWHEAELALKAEGLDEFIASTAIADLGNVRTASCLAMLPTSALQDIPDLYAECYGRTFFVREFNGTNWVPELVLGKPHAEYRLASTANDNDTSMLRVDVMADADGKCGAAQMIHMLNVMAGFEEDLGVTADRN